MSLKVCEGHWVLAVLALSPCVPYPSGQSDPIPLSTLSGRSAETSHIFNVKEPDWGWAMFQEVDNLLSLDHGFLYEENLVVRVDLGDVQVCVISFVLVAPLSTMPPALSTTPLLSGIPLVP